MSKDNEKLLNSEISNKVNKEDEILNIENNGSEEDKKYENEESIKNTNSKKLSIVIGAVCIFLIGLQFVCFYFFNFEIEITIIIEFVSIILSVIVCFGFIKGEKKEDISQTKEQIKDTIQNILSNVNLTKSKKNKKSDEE